MPYRSLGLFLATLAPLVVLSYACNCGGGDPPRREECSAPDDDAVVSSMRVTGEHVFGIQGGQHVQARVFLEGSGLGTCTNFEAWIESADGGRSHMTSGAIPLDGSETSTRSSDIYFYVDSSPSDEDRIGVTMLGRTVYTGCISRFCPDGGPEGSDAGHEDGGAVSADAASTDEDGGAGEDGGADEDGGAG